jgi:hypothetical protein
MKFYFTLRTMINYNIQKSDFIYINIPIFSIELELYLIPYFADLRG